MGRRITYWCGGVGPGMVLITFDPGSRSGVAMLTSTKMQPFDTRMAMAGFALPGALADVKGSEEIATH